jgi:hypothetical protein
MFYQPMTIEVDDAAAFMTMAKDLKPIGRVIVFEQDGNGAYKFLTRSGEDLMGVMYRVRHARHPISDPNGTVSHDINGLSGSFEMAVNHLMKETDVKGKEMSRVRKYEEAYKKLLASSKPTIIKWTSQNDRLANIKINIHNVSCKATVTLQYTNVHVKELTRMLEEAGMKVVLGKIRRS